MNEPQRLADVGIAETGEPAERPVGQALDLGIDAIATRTGFGTAAVLRHHFTRRVGATPNSYRTTFRTREAA